MISCETLAKKETIKQAIEFSLEFDLINAYYFNLFNCPAPLEIMDYFLDFYNDSNIKSLYKKKIIALRGTMVYIYEESIF